MWKDIVLALVAALMAPTLILVWKIFRVVVVFREYPPHLHVGDKIKFPVGMEPGKVEELGERRGAAAG